MARGVDPWDTRGAVPERTSAGAGLWPGPSPRTAPTPCGQEEGVTLNVVFSSTAGSSSLGEDSCRLAPCNRGEV